MMHLVISCLFKGIYIYISTIHSTRLGMEGVEFQGKVCISKV